MTHSGLSYQRPSGKDLHQQGHIRLIRPINYVESAISRFFLNVRQEWTLHPICNHDRFFDRELYEFYEFSEIEDWLRRIYIYQTVIPAL